MFGFPIPKPQLKFSHNKDLHCFDKILDSFPVHSVQFLIPSSNSYKENYKDALLSDECTYFIVEDITATCLIQTAFLENFVKSGLLLGVTCDARIEIENFICVTPPGNLVLSLEKSIAQSLALHKETHKKEKKQKFFETIIIDLTCPELIPGKKHYQFIATELSKIDSMKFRLLLRWKPKANACVQSLKSYFRSQGLECTAYTPKYKEYLKWSVPVPTINYEERDHDIINEILEWAGMQICGLEYSVDLDDYVNKLVVPEHFTAKGVLHRCSFEGFYSKLDILPVIKEMSKIFETDTSLPFIAVCLSGFQDSFVQANGFHFFSSDDKLIYVLIFPSSNYWVLTLNCR